VDQGLARQKSAEVTPQAGKDPSAVPNRPEAPIYKGETGTQIGNHFCPVDRTVNHEVPLKDPNGLFPPNPAAREFCVYRRRESQRMSRSKSSMHPICGMLMAFGGRYHETKEGLSAGSASGRTPSCWMWLAGTTRFHTQVTTPSWRLLPDFKPRP